MDDMVYGSPPSVKVSPEAQSTPEDGADFTSTNFGNVLHFVRVHAHNAGDSDLLVGPGVVQVGSLAECSLIDADVGELSVIVFFQLECQADKRQRVVWHKLDRLLGLGLVEGHVLDLGGIREIVTDGIEHGLDRLVGKSGSHQDRREHASSGRPADRGLDLRIGRLLFLEIDFGNFVVDVCQLLNQDLALLGGQRLQRAGDLVRNSNLGPARALKVHGLHLNQVDDALKLVFGSDGDLDGGGGHLELGVDLFHCLPGVGTHAVHLVDEGDSRDIVALHLAVDGGGLRLHAADGAEDHDGAVEDSEGSLDLDGEVNVARRVDQVEVVGFLLAVFRLLPVAKRGGRLNGNTLFPLKFHGVHLGADGIFAPDLVDSLDATGVEEDSFRHRRLAAVDVGL